MNATEPPPDTEPMPFEWLFRRVTLLRLLIVLGVVATAIMVLYFMENLRGERALASLQADMRARGRPASLAQAVPPAPPADQNFALTPLLAPALDYVRTTNGETSSIRWDNPITRNHLELVTFSRGQYAGKEPARGKWSAGRGTDLAAWQAYYRAPARQLPLSARVPRILPPGLYERYAIPPDTTAGGWPELPAFPVAPQLQSPAEDVLLALDKVGVDLDQLEAETLVRPFTRFPVHYDEKPAYGILLPHLGLLKRLTFLAQLRASARLAAGQVDGAAADVLFTFRLAEAPAREPLIISHLVRLACWTEALQVVWEGVVAHGWQERHLVAFEKVLRDVDLLAGQGTSLTGEQWLIDAEPRSLDERRQLILAFSEFNTPGEDQAGVDPRFSLYTLLGPRGWFLQNHVRYARVLQARMDLFQRMPGTPLATNLARPSPGEQEFRYHPTPYGFIADRIGTSGGNWRTNAIRTLHGQTDINLARVAIALERHRLAQGMVPETLARLAPDFLERVPVDLMGGQPLHYARREGGGCLLYSVGVNGQDDGGTPPAKEDGFDGDWCWPGETKPALTGTAKSAPVN